MKKHICTYCFKYDTSLKCSDCGLCFVKNRRENFFVLVPLFFFARARVKKFTRHTFRHHKPENLGT